MNPLLIAGALFGFAFLAGKKTAPAALSPEAKGIAQSHAVKEAQAGLALIDKGKQIYSLADRAKGFIRSPSGRVQSSLGGDIPLAPSEISLGGDIPLSVSSELALGGDIPLAGMESFLGGDIPLAADFVGGVALPEAGEAGAVISGLELTSGASGVEGLVGAEIGAEALGEGAAVAAGTEAGLGAAALAALPFAYVAAMAAGAYWAYSKGRTEQIYGLNPFVDSVGLAPYGTPPQIKTLMSKYPDQTLYKPDGNNYLYHIKGPLVLLMVNGFNLSNEQDILYTIQKGLPETSVFIARYERQTGTKPSLGEKTRKEEAAKYIGWMEKQPEYVEAVWKAETMMRNRYYEVDGHQYPSELSWLGAAPNPAPQFDTTIG